MIQDLLVQWLELLARMAGVLGVGLLAGWGGTLLFVPRRFAFRWIVFTPLLGMAVMTVAGLPLSVTGIPVKAFVWPLVTGLGVCGLVVTLLLKRRHVLLRQGRILAYLRARGGRLLVLAGLITALSTYMMTAQARSKVVDVWGSGDFSAYWAVSDYLLHHGGNKAVYEAQTEFRSDDIHAHLVLHARLGNMVYLAQIAGICEPAHFHRMINPLIIAMMLLLVGLGASWLEFIRCRAFWPLLVIACHPFLYFLLYFSYLSQATSVVLTFAGFLVARDAVRGAMPRCAARLGGVAAGILYASALLHHPTMAPVIGSMAIVLLISVIWAPTHDRNWAVLLCAGVTVLGFTAYYFPAIWRELTFLGGSALPGWEWARPIGFSEISGLRTVLGYSSLPPPMTRSRWLVEIVAGVFLTSGVALAWITRRDRLVIGTLGGVTVLLVAGTLIKVFQHVPNATHSYVKAISLFVIILLLACLAPWVRLLDRLPSRFAGLVTASLLLVWIPYELRALRFGSFQGPQFTEALIGLVRRRIAQGSHLVFDPKLVLDTQQKAPIVRDTDWLNQNVADPGGVVIITKDRSVDGGQIIDEAGPYIAIRPAAAGAPKTTRP